jgi:hypothetical protein
MSYLYETHLHTSFSSACGSSKGSKYIKGYKDRGYSGIVVTDHFYNGNTAVPRNLPWKEWVNRFCRGYEEARNEGERQGLDVFFGWEETFDGCDDYLVYGLNKEWLLENPGARHWTRGEQYAQVRAAGGCVIQAHPFRQHSYIRRVVLSSGCVDAVEAANAGNAEQSYDALAMRYAQKMKLPFTAGSDIHEEGQLRSGKIYGVFFEKKIGTAAELVNAVCNGITGISVPEGRCDYRGDERIVLPLDVRDKNDRSTGKSLKDIL